MVKTTCSTNWHQISTSTGWIYCLRNVFMLLSVLIQAELLFHTVTAAAWVFQWNRSRWWRHNACWEEKYNMWHLLQPLQRSKLLSYAALTAVFSPHWYESCTAELKANFPRKFDICMQPLFNHSVGGSHLSIQSVFQRAQTHSQVCPPWAGKTNKEEEHWNINLWE